MEILKELPNEIKSKIFKYQSHPVADLVREYVGECKKDARKKRLRLSYYDYWCSIAGDSVLSSKCSSCGMWMNCDFIRVLPNDKLKCIRCNDNYKGLCRKKTVD